MKNQKTADFYNKFYSDDEKAFGTEALPLVKALSELISAGEVLDIGAGTGRNSLFLASKGFDVTANDISGEGLKRIVQKAAENNIPIKTEVFDIVEKELTQEFDAVISAFVFNFMSRQDALDVIAKMQKHTKSGGYNVLMVFTKNGDFFKNNPDTPNFYLNHKEELEGLYKGWKIIKSFEKEGKARALDTEGKPQFNTFAGLLAQKDIDAVIEKKKQRKQHRPYQLQEYDPKWRDIFLSTANRIKSILGDNVLEIEHIGSTSIVGMVAKPQVDILVVVENLELVKESYDAFISAGFTSHGRGYVAEDDEYFSEDAPDGRRLASIHIFERGNAKINEYKNFRDYLQNNEADRELYIATKRGLYSSHQDDYAAYDSGKKDVITAIKARAKVWASKV